MTTAKPGDEDARVDRMARDAREAEADGAREVERGDEARVERRRVQREADDVGRCEESREADREALRGAEQEVRPQPPRHRSQRRRARRLGASGRQP